MADTMNDSDMQHRNRMAEDICFKGKTLFMTGGSGFMGKVFIEKLLRTCPGVERIYMLVRSRKGKNPQDRLKNIISCPIFDHLKQLRGLDIFKKLVAISGDVTEINLGLTSENRKFLANETQIIVHLAATIRFDESLRKTVLINTRGTKFMLDFAKECKQLLVFSYVSTAYCHLEEKVLHEKAYPPPADPYNIIKAMEWMDEDTINSISAKLLGTCPNGYAFSKALAEALVNDEMHNLPVIIIRPSVVIPVWKEPLPGWSENLHGPLGLLIAAGKGVLRTMYCNAKGYADFIPVDVAINCVILAIGDYLLYKERRFYNCTSSFEFKISWDEIIELGRGVVEKKLPLNGVVWYPGGSMKKSRFIHQICVILFHYIPAIFLDAFIFLSGNKPVLWKVQQRITRGFEVFEYYANNQWEFNNDGSLNARNLLTTEEREVYKVDGQGMNLEEYFLACTHAARLYILKEADDTIPAARTHMRRMWYLDRFCKLLMILGFLYYTIQYIVYPIMSY